MQTVLNGRKTKGDTFLHKAIHLIYSDKFSAHMVYHFHSFSADSVDSVDIGRKCPMESQN